MSLILTIRMTEEYNLSDVNSDNLKSSNCVIQILEFYFQFAFNLYFFNLSRLVCKLSQYVGYMSDPVSGFLLIYISLEKFIAIRYPTHRHILNQTRNQIIYLVCVLFYCSTVNSLMAPFIFDLLPYNKTGKNWKIFFFKIHSQSFIIFVCIRFKWNIHRIRNILWLH